MKSSTMTPILKPKSKRIAYHITKRIKFINTCLETGIHDDNTLWLFILFAFGYEIPRKAVCVGHQAPFDFVADLFFERVDNALILGNRHGGKTLLIVGILNFLNLLFKPKHSTTSSAAILSQANTGYKHFKRLIRNAWFLKQDQVVESIQTRTIFSNQAELEVIVSTMDGFNSKHPNTLIVDEVDLIKDWAIIEEAFSMSSSVNGYLAQNIFLSTRKSATGTMQKLISECKDRGFKLYSFCVWEVSEKCREKIDCLECGIYTKCESKARLSKGFLSIKDIRKKAKNMDSNTWQAQWSCQKPISSGNFFDFYRDIHTISMKSFCDRYNLPFEETNTRPESIIPISWQRFCSIDWGFGDPLCMLAFTIDPENDIIYCYRELYEKAMSVTDILNLWQGFTRHQSGKYIFNNSSYNWQNEPFSWIVCDSSRPEIRADLNRLRAGKTLFSPIKNKEKSHEYSFTKLRERLMVNDDTKLPKLVFFNNCENSIREFDALLTGENGLPKKGQDDHGVDAVRYFVSRLTTIENMNKIKQRQDENLKRLYG